MRPLLALAVGLALLLAPSAHAAPAWLPAASIPGEGTRAGEAQLAFGPDGTLVAVWHEGDLATQTINAAARPPGGPFGPVETLAGPTSGLGFPRVAVDAQGTALVTWVQVVGARFAVRPPGGPFGPADDVPRPADENVNSAIAVAFDAQGNALAAWAGSQLRMDGGLDVRVRATVRPPGGSFGPPVALDEGINDDDAFGDPIFSVNSVDVASAGAGDLIASWSLQCCMVGIDTSRIRVAVRSPGGPFGPAQTLDSSTSGPATAVYSPRPAGSAQGSAIVVWGKGQSASSGNVAACARPPGGSFSGCTIENVSGTGTQPSSLDVGLDAQGNAVASWSRKLPSGSDPDAVQVAGRPAGFSAWTPLGTYSEAGVALTHPELAASRQGAAIVTWQRGTDRIDGAARAAGGAFGASQPLSESGGNPFRPQVAMDPDGNGAAAWERGAPDTLVEVAGYDGAGPRLSGLSIPPEGATGQPLPFAVTATDVWSPVQSIDWSFGDGTGASGGQVTHAYGGSGGALTVAATAADSLGNATSLSGATQISDITMPVLSRLRMTRRRFAVGRARTPLLGSRVLRGTAFRFELSEPARVTIRIERKLRGRRVGRSCRIKLRRGRRCSVYRRVGVLTRHSRQDGANRVPFSGRLGRKALAPGSYRATLRAFDAARNRSAARRIGFTTLRR